MDSRQNDSNVSTERTLGRLETLMASLQSDAISHEKEAANRHTENVARINGVAKDVAANHDVVVSLGARLIKIEQYVAMIESPVKMLMIAQQKRAYLIGMSALAFTALIEMIHYGDLLIDSLLHIRELFSK